jgi:hypothetical protein
MIIDIKNVYELIVARLHDYYTHTMLKFNILK